MPAFPPILLKSCLEVQGAGGTSEQVSANLVLFRIENITALCFKAQNEWEVAIIMVFKTLAITSEDH